MITRRELDELAELTATLESLVLLAPVVTTREQRRRWAGAIAKAAQALAIVARGGPDGEAALGKYANIATPGDSADKIEDFDK
ncbi:MAG: hypothetical protein IT383_20755 [Deltaproteobacteria bacterium]|nr:hypothetical protein [Deltaproteobacteria bacterium]